MRDLFSIARRLLETRAVYRELERAGAEQGELATLDASRLLLFKGAAQALAWALDIDLNLLDSPALTNLPEPVTTVQLHRIDLSPTRRYWLMEVPAERDDGDEVEAAASADVRGDSSTEAWSAFLSDEQARQLRVALARALSTPVIPLHTTAPATTTATTTTTTTTTATTGSARPPSTGDGKGA